MTSERQLDVAWDAFLSFLLRGVFVVMLVGGLWGLAWCYDASHSRFWDDDEVHIRKLTVLLAGLAAAFGALGTFRPGRQERKFSVLAAGAALANVPVHVPDYGGRRTLLRFPIFEGVAYGSILIALWAAAQLRPQTWKAHALLVVGAALLCWSAALCLRRAGRSHGPAL